MRALMPSRRALQDTPDVDDGPGPRTGRPPSDGMASRASRVGEIAEVVATTWALRRGHVVAVSAILLLAVIGAGVMVIRDRPVRESVDEPLSRAAVVSGAPSPSAPAGASVSPSPPVLVVHVAGKVRKPGVIRLPAGSRVTDAVAAAGGALPGVDLSSLNLARPLADGEQVLVGVTPPPGAPGTGATGSASPGQPGGAGSAVLVDLNTATAEALEQLPGVGPVLAQRILEFRTTHGRFSSVQELQDVTGIGERKFADLKPRVTVS